MCRTLAFGYITRGVEADSCQFRFESHKYHKASRYTAMAFLKTTLILGLVFFSIAHISQYKLTFNMKKLSKNVASPTFLLFVCYLLLDTLPGPLHSSDRLIAILTIHPITLSQLIQENLSRSREKSPDSAGLGPGLG